MFLDSVNKNLDCIMFFTLKKKNWGIFMSCETLGSEISTESN